MSACSVSMQNGCMGLRGKRYAEKEGKKQGRKVTDPTIDGNAAVRLAHGMALISDELSESLQRTCKGQYRFCDPSNADCLRDIIAYVQARHAFIIIYTSIDLHIAWCGSRDEPDSGAALPVRSSEAGAGDGRRGAGKSKVPHRTSLPRRPSSSSPSRLIMPDLWCMCYVRSRRSKLASSESSWCNELLPSYGYKLAPKWINDEDVQDGSSRHKACSTTRTLAAMDADLSYKHAFNLISGEHGIIISFVGTQAWIRYLNYSVVDDDRRPWIVNGQIGG
ncbi:hypothetical protein SAY86_020523 [Trapa natans]|uniref:Uncharacterized protein n=1 Tax=Trapa natans TaxID=22666 RepID=A0AAN7LPX7_TRANT|nr:hypothetical protein SAY86_020523 [Trapa natans]